MGPVSVSRREASGSYHKVDTPSLPRTVKLTNGSNMAFTIFNISYRGDFGTASIAPADATFIRATWASQPVFWVANRMDDNDPTRMTDSRRKDPHTTIPAPNSFMPHPGFSDGVNRNIAQSEIEGGVHLDALSDGAVLEVETQHHWYTIVNRSDGEVVGYFEFFRAGEGPPAVPYLGMPK